MRTRSQARACFNNNVEDRINTALADQRVVCMRVWELRPLLLRNRRRLFHYSQYQPCQEPLQESLLVFQLKLKVA